MNNKLVEQLENELTDIFGESVTVELISEKSFEGTSVVVCNMSYTKRSNDSETRDQQIRQTAVVLGAADLDLPEFTLSPALKGIAGMIFSRLGGFGDLKFSDSPEFSKQYRVHGWVEEPVRILFTPEIREHFSKRLGWSVRGKESRLVIVQHNQVRDENQIDEFVNDCLPMLELFQQGEQALDERPELRRKTQSSDVVATAGRMGGFVGASIQRQLRAFTVTPDQLKTFLSDSPPRAIPAQIKRQVMGNNLPLVFVGLLFVVAGLVVGSIILMTAAGPPRWMGLSMMIMMPLVGGLMSVLTILYRRKKARVLKSGALVNGQIVKVKRTTTSVNNQAEHKVTINYSANGTETTTTCSVYGIAGRQARELADSGDSVRLLIDPQDDQHVVCPDLLVMAE